jgi:copper(I)-binding protein
MQTLLLLLLTLFPPQDNIKIKDAWIRPSSEKMATALYFTIENTGEMADTLYKVVSNISDKVELHETYSQGDMMGMRKVDFIVIAGKSSFELKPGAHHIMVMKLKKDIKDGDVENFTLYFKQAGEIKIIAKAKM